MAKPASKFLYDGVADGTIPLALQTAIRDGYLSDKTPLAMMINLDAFRDRCTKLTNAFIANGLNEENIVNAFALKSLQLGPLCTELNNLPNCGIECASFGEVMIAVESNVPSHKIVFDSPCKTYEEIKYCILNKIYLNVDSFQELERVADIIAKEDVDPNDLHIGIRVNPVVGKGSIAALSTSTKHTKFGILLTDKQNKKKLMQLYKKHQPWLNSIHCHVGSQGMALTQMVKGVSATIDFAETELNGLVKRVDIGGGLSANYNGYDNKPEFMDYTNVLKQQVPVLFSNKYQVWTEFGRSVAAKPGWFATKIEYTKEVGKDKRIAFGHLGANMLVREVYNSNIWKHYVTVYDANGVRKKMDDDKSLFNYDIAGPLCFSGDIIAHNRLLPNIEQNDWIVMHDTGSTTISMYSMHNTRRFPPVYGFESVGDHINIKVLKKGQTFKDVAKFWCGASKL